MHIKRAGIISGFIKGWYGGLVYVLTGYATQRAEFVDSDNFNENNTISSHELRRLPW